MGSIDKLLGEGWKTMDGIDGAHSMKSRQKLSRRRGCYVVCLNENAAVDQVLSKSYYGAWPTMTSYPNR